MAKERHARRCRCTMNPKLYRRKLGWRVECNYCGRLGAFAASKDGAINAWSEGLDADAV